MRNIWISVTPVSFVGCIPKVLFAFLSSETPPILDTKLPLMYLVFSVHGLLPLFAIQIVQHNCCRAISFLFTVFVSPSPIPFLFLLLLLLLLFQYLSSFCLTKFNPFSGFFSCCCCCSNIFPVFCFCLTRSNPLPVCCHRTHSCAKYLHNLVYSFSVKHSVACLRLLAKQNLVDAYKFSYWKF